MAQFDGISGIGDVDYPEVQKELGISGIGAVDFPEAQDPITPHNLFTLRLVKILCTSIDKVNN